MRDKNGFNLTTRQMINKVFNRASTILLEFELMILRFVGHIPLHTLRKIIYRLAGLNLPWSSTIHIHANFFNPANITIGENSIIGNNCFLDGRASLVIGNHVDIASEVLIYNNEHDINDQFFGNSYGAVTIGDYVFIGPRAIILPGVTIGKGAVVAAGAVVTKDIPSLEVWGGVPAKKIADRQIVNPSYRLGRAMLFQ